MMVGMDVGEYANVIKEEALKKGILINVTNKRVIRLVPPLTINHEDVNLCIDALKNIFDEI
jgi:acetylornithine/succinyldiaminopimelate/putrescine aminotransferase